MGNTTTSKSILIRYGMYAEQTSQLRELTPILAKMSAEQAGEVHPSLPLLKQILEEFRDDELEHLDTAVEEGAQRAPGHALLGAVIGWGCKAAIGVCKRI